MDIMGLVCGVQRLLQSRGCTALSLVCRQKDRLKMNNKADSKRFPGQIHLFENRVKLLICRLCICAIIRLCIKFWRTIVTFYVRGRHWLSCMINIGTYRNSNIFRESAENNVTHCTQRYSATRHGNIVHRQLPYSTRKLLLDFIHSLLFMHVIIERAFWSKMRRKTEVQTSDNEPINADKKVRQLHMPQQVS